MLVLGAVVFTLSAYVEELLFRVLMLGGLVRLTGRPWLALTVMALAVGAFHVATTAHTTLVSVVSSTLGGVMYGVAFLRTGNLWLGLGVHIGWNWIQGTILGFTVSGTDDYSGAVLEVHTSGAGLARRRRLRPGGQRAVAGRPPGDHRADRGRHGTGSPFTRYFQ